MRCREGISFKYCLACQWWGKLDITFLKSKLQVPWSWLPFSSPTADVETVCLIMKESLLDLETKTSREEGVLFSPCPFSQEETALGELSGGDNSWSDISGQEKTQGLGSHT